jgi:uncharacterized glyoxalase superfamily protein PhnB
MIQNRSIPAAVVIPELAYSDVAEAAAWLCSVFGFQERLRIANHRVQLSVGELGAVIVIEGSARADTPNDRSHSVMVRIDDLVAHHARAKALGARILRDAQEYPYGERQYTAQDLGGHVWTFSQSMRDVDPASWGGTVVPGRLGA